jgi:hypothetical protein
MNGEWEPADRPDTIQAFTSEGHLLFIILGSKRTADSEIRIALGPEDVWPPVYELRWRQTDDGPSVPTGYLLATCAEQGGSPFVTVRDDLGQQRIDTQPMREATLAGACAQVSRVFEER